MNLRKLTARYIPKHLVQFIETDQFKQAVNWDPLQPLPIWWIQLGKTLPSLVRSEAGFQYWQKVKIFNASVMVIYIQCRE